MGLALALLLLLPPAGGAEEAFEVILPAGYAEGDLRYPTVYVLPEKTGGKDESGLARALDEGLRAGDGMDMILVRPVLTDAAEAPAQLRRVIEKVDAAYRTVPDREHRAAAGVGSGGYLAYALALEQDGPFGAAVSVRGNFGEEGNPFFPALGSVFDRLDAVHRDDQQALEKLYTYLDAPVEDAWTDLPGSTDDLGLRFIGYGIGSQHHEFTVRPGVFTEDYLAESAARIADRLTRSMLSGLLTAEMTPEKSALTAADEKVRARFTVTVSDAARAYAEGKLPLAAEVWLEDRAAGETVAKTAAKLTAAENGTFAGEAELDARIGKEGADLKLRLGVLGAWTDAASALVTRKQEMVMEGDSRFLDLSGDWHFHYAGTGERLDAAALKAGDFAAWPIVQPGQGNWTKGYGDISDENVASGYGPDYFDFFIVGSGYYARTFTVPAGFDREKLVLSLGYVDDRCEAFINGVRVGATGMDEKGAPTGETTWAVFSHFDIEKGLLRENEENVLVVRAWNDLPYGAGGWYAGPVALYSRDLFNGEFSRDGNPRFYEETFDSAYFAASQGKQGTAENKYLIYLPEGYGESRRSYPTVYLLHQFNSDHTSYRTDGIDRLLDEGIRAGLFDPMIVVIPNSSEESWWRGGWERMITEELIPHIDGKYRTVRDARFRLTAGCSMGGQGAYGVALRNPDFFSGVISFFGAFSYGRDADPNAIAAKESAEYLRSFALYFICGNQDNYGFGAPAIRLHQKLLAKGVPHRFFIENGSHDSAFYLPFFQDAFAYVRDAMYHSGKEADAVFRGALTLEGTALRAEWTAEGIEGLLRETPASSYTKQPHPALSVPMTVEIRRGDETVVLMENRDLLATPEETTGVMEATLPDGIDPGTEMEIIFRAFPLDREIELARLAVPAR